MVISCLFIPKLLDGRQVLQLGKEVFQYHCSKKLSTSITLSSDTAFYCVLIYSGYQSHTARVSRQQDSYIVHVSDTSHGLYFFLWHTLIKSIQQVGCTYVRGLHVINFNVKYPECIKKHSRTCLLQLYLVKNLSEINYSY